MAETDIGFVLSVGTFAALASRSPAGALVDRFHYGRLRALLAIVAVVRLRRGSGIRLVQNRRWLPQDQAPGRDLVEWFFVLTATAYNLVRISKILAAAG